MTHLLDTDTVSIWQPGTGPEYAVLALRMSAYPTTDIGVSSVNFHEQMIGANALLNRARTAAEVVRAYELLERLHRWYSQQVFGSLRRGRCWRL